MTPFLLTIHHHALTALSEKRDGKKTALDLARGMQAGNGTQTLVEAFGNDFAISSGHEDEAQLNRLLQRAVEVELKESTGITAMAEEFESGETIASIMPHLWQESWVFAVLVSARALSLNRAIDCGKGFVKTPTITAETIFKAATSVMSQN